MYQYGYVSIHATERYIINYLTNKFLSCVLNTYWDDRHDLNQPCLLLSVLILYELACQSSDIPYPWADFISEESCGTYKSLKSCLEQNRFAESHLHCFTWAARGASDNNKETEMSILKATWDRLIDPSSNSGSGFRSILPLWGTTYMSRYILDYNSRMALLGLDGPPTLSLAGQSFTFLEGRWVSSSPRQSSKSRSRIQRLKQRKQALEEENKALKLRLELLMDMLTETSAQLEGLQQERRTGKRPLPKEVTLVT